MESPEDIQQEAQEDLVQSHPPQNTPNASDGGDCRELQETPRTQQYTSATTEEDRIVNGDVSREDLDLLRDHTQHAWPQLGGTNPEDDQSIAQTLTGLRNG